MAVKRQIDWEAIERDYRAGILSLRAIAAAHGCSHVAIQKKADKEIWTRDLSAKIRAAAEAKVTKAAVTKLVTAESKATEREIVDANATMQSDIIVSHRTDVQRSRKLVMSLLNELEEQTENLELYQQLGELLHAPDDKGVDKLNELYRKVISLNGRTGTMKSLADSLKTLVGLEREAFGIDGKPESKSAHEASLDDLA